MPVLNETDQVIRARERFYKKINAANIEFLKSLDFVICNNQKDDRHFKHWK